MDERNTEPLSPRVYALKLHTAYVIGGALVLVNLAAIYAYVSVDANRTSIEIKRGEFDIANASSERARHESETAKENATAAMWNHMQCVPAEKK